MYDWFVKTQVWEDSELKDELKRLNVEGWEVFSVQVISDAPDRESRMKATIIARKNI